MSVRAGVCYDETETGSERRSPGEEDVSRNRGKREKEQREQARVKWFCSLKQRASQLSPAIVDPWRRSKDSQFYGSAADCFGPFAALRTL